MASISQGFTVTAVLRQVRKQDEIGASVGYGLRPGTDIEILKGVRLRALDSGRSSRSEDDEEELEAAGHAIIELMIRAKDDESALREARPRLETIVAAMGLVTPQPMFEIDEANVRVDVSSESSSTMRSSSRVDFHLDGERFRRALSKLGVGRLARAAASSRGVGLDRALHWYHLGAILNDPASSFLAFWVGVEVLAEGILSTAGLSLKGGGYVGVKDVRAALDVIDAEHLGHRMGLMYRRRGQIVHHGEAPTRPQREEAQLVLREMILRHATGKSIELDAGGHGAASMSWTTSVTVD